MPEVAKVRYICPGCRRRIRAPEDRYFKCPACGAAVEPVDSLPMPEAPEPAKAEPDAAAGPEPPPKPPPEPPKPSYQPLAPSTLPASRRTRGQQMAVTAMMFGLIGLAAGVGFGAMASQYFPLFGGFVVQIAEPFSRVRLETLPAHCIVSGSLAALVGGGIGVLLRYAK